MTLLQNNCKRKTSITCHAYTDHHPKTSPPCSIPASHYCKPSAGSFLCQSRPWQASERWKRHMSTQLTLSPGYLKGNNFPGQAFHGGSLTSLRAAGWGVLVGTFTWNTGSSNPQLILFLGEKTCAALSESRPKLVILRVGEHRALPCSQAQKDMKKAGRE